MKTKIYLTLSVLFLSLASVAQSFDKAKLDSYFDALEANDKFMGSVAVSKNGKVIYTKSVGYASLKDSIKANVNSKYRIGSITKTFTTVLALKAKEAGKLNLDKTIENYFPTIPNADKITIRQLLTHRSGIHNFTDDKEYLFWNTKPKTEKELVELIANGGSDFEPDSKAQYSNSNFVLLTFILQDIYKSSYEKLISKYITKPLALKNTYVSGKIDVMNNECQSYNFNGSWVLSTETDASIPLGAGSLISTPTDLVKFSDALFSGKLLQKENLKLMQAIKDNYGMGLFPFPFYNKTGFGHTGGIDAFSSIFVHFSDGEVSYAMTSNGSNYNTNDISIAALSAVYNKPYTIPVFTSYEVSSKDLDKYVGSYASAQLPIKITISKDLSGLKAQASGQAAFSLEASEKDIFKFDRAGIILEFNPEEKTMILKQGGGVFTFTKE
ncbi:MAG: beta-lactamase family protein [Cyclobacteriaceae bacterium]|nr:beta-lactamase family protein [Cyclobacteriaceae bacterium]